MRVRSRSLIDNSMFLTERCEFMRPVLPTSITSYPFELLSSLPLSFSSELLELLECFVFSLQQVDECIL
ncbi:uncharacterized protein M6B38_386990 [Iris pallida]|uniref:Uncharacterized protein n=1 Tax=Iris pallida TaxID=29817 RepID=A0AAX6G2F3_IRIPA|nr:uncharacterized protein M6B38_386990 [Iris pallida]